MLKPDTFDAICEDAKAKVRAQRQADPLTGWAFISGWLAAVAFCLLVSAFVGWLVLR